jgi:outer membrane biosynthesis protein TonB
MSQSLVSTRNRISLSSGQRDEYALLAWIGSVGLHAAIVVAMLFTFTRALDIVDQTPMVPVDLVTLGPKTNVMAMVKAVKAPPKDVPVPTPPAPEQMQVPVPTPAPPQAAEPAPPKPDQAVKAEPTPTPQAKPKPPTPDKQKSQDQQLAALLNKLTAPTAAPKNVKTADHTVKGVGAMNQMVADLQSSLASQIYQCWSPPIGAPRADELVVEFDLFLNPDGSVARPPQLTAQFAAAALADPYTKAAADAARRAIYQCAPYKLPADRYSQWKEIYPFHFDPRQMMGQ